MGTRWEGLAIQLLRLPGRRQAVKAAARRAAIRGLRATPTSLRQARPRDGTYIAVQARSCRTAVTVRGSCHANLPSTHRALDASVVARVGHARTSTSAV